MKQYLIPLLETALQTVCGEKQKVLLESPKNEDFGDYACTNAMALAKSLRKNPAIIAQEIADALPENDILEKIELVGAFLNITVSPHLVAEEIEKYDPKSPLIPQKKRRIVIDSSHPNIAKPLHFGHFRSTVIGNALRRILLHTGHDVFSDNFLGNWGTNFGKLIVAIRTWGDMEKITKNPTQELVALYQKFHQELEKNPTLGEQAAEEFRKMEQDGNEENMKLWKWIVEASLTELQKFYDRLNVHFDSIRGEQFYENLLSEVIKKLETSGVAKREEGGALIVEFEDHPTQIFQKSDGATLYQTRDIARLLFYEKEKCDELLYVVANEQHLYFEQIFATAKRLGLSKKYSFAGFGMVLGGDGKKFSTRKGNSVELLEVLDEAAAKAEEKIERVEGEEKKRLAEIVGIGALKFNDLSQSRQKDIVFDWNRMLDFNGFSAPFLQYSAVRCTSILEKAGGSDKAKSVVFTHEWEIKLAKKILEFSEVVERCAETYEPHHLAQYLFELASTFNRFYTQCPILKSEGKERETRLFLTEKTEQTLKKGLEILGIETPERM